MKATERRERAWAARIPFSPLDDSDTPTVLAISVEVEAGSNKFPIVPNNNNIFVSETSICAVNIPRASETILVTVA